jgi:hypothetical protein
MATVQSFVTRRAAARMQQRGIPPAILERVVRLRRH